MFRLVVAVTAPPPALAQQTPTPPAKADQREIDPYCPFIGVDIEHGDALRQACSFAVSLRKKLPNFTCNETMKRFVDQPPGAGKFPRPPKQYDEIQMRVRYENGSEEFSDVTRNGTPVSDLSILGGSWSEGEFGSFLRGVFSPDSLSQFRFKKTFSVKGENALIFQYRVEQERNDFWVLQTWEKPVSSTTHTKGAVASAPPAKGAAARSGIRGEVWVRESDFHLMRFTMQATDIAKDFPMQFVGNDVAYSDTAMGDGTTFVLPSVSRSTVCPLNGLCQNNLLQFQNCQKFKVETRILPAQEVTRREGAFSLDICDSLDASPGCC